MLALATATVSGGPFAAAVAETPPASAPFYPAVEGLTEVRSLDVVADAHRIHALLVGRFTQRGRVAVAYSFSRDGGWTWSRPGFVDPDDAPPPISRRGNDAQLAVRGQALVAVWQIQGDTPVSGPMAVAISTDAGKSWTPGGNPAVGDATRNQSHMALAVNRAGDFHLAWLDDREENGNTQGLRYARSRNAGHDWLPEATLDPATCTCCWNRLQRLSDRGIALLYRDADPHDMRLALLPSGHGRWRDAGAVGRFGWHFTGCPHCGGGLATTGSGRDTILHSVVWTGKEGIAGLYYLRSRNAGAGWSAPLRIGNEQSREGDMAARPDGELALAFVSGGTDGTPVFVRKSPNAGQRWSPPSALTAPHMTADHPRVVATATGFRVFWTESRQGGGKTWAMGAL